MTSDREILHYFLNLKSSYETQRKSWTRKWLQARAAYNADDSLDKTYMGRAQINVPIVDWKINGLIARINRILFNVPFLGRFESQKTKVEQEDIIVNIWNKYIFGYQLDKIGFIPELKLFIKDKSILGTAVAKVIQEFSVGKFSYFEDNPEEEVILKDDTRFQTIQLEEFYSDIAKPNINDSEACIHSTTVSLSDLHALKGIYKNLELLHPTGENISPEQLEYLQRLGVTKAAQASFQKSLKNMNKTGFVPIDECYGRYDLDGDGVPEEVLVTIAHGSVVIRSEPTPFRHKKYVRPFIVGRYIPLPHCLYGESKVIKSLPLLMELNASRAQALDAKTRAVAPMYYLSTSNGEINFDGKWTPDKVITGIASTSPLQPIINPDLSHVSIDDSLLVQADIDKVFNISPAQEGSARRSQVPETFRGTAAIIAQNDMPINDIIETTAEEMKIFFEMLYERDLRFKTIADIAEIVPIAMLQEVGLTPESTMADVAMNLHGISILGNMELSNEGAMQQGWSAFAEFAMTNPAVGARVDWLQVGKKILRAYGIKDDSEDVWIDEATAQQQAQQQDQQKQAAEQKAIQTQASLERDKQMAKAEAKIAEMGAEAHIEQITGAKIQ